MRLRKWIDWQAMKHEAPLAIVDPRGTFSECPLCGSKLVENGYRRLKCLRCGFEADRDLVEVLDIRREALAKMGGSLTTLNAPQIDRCKPE
ncbi:MAG: zinc ribbon domain-containing protein [Sulfolobales archaeon]